MILPEISIKRPILASMMSIALVIIGIVALFDLPVREVPDIDPPVVNVTTTYLGASSRVIETEVTERLEEAINGIEGIKQLTSESREELSRVTVEFELWRNVDVAAQDVRDRVARVRGGLPDDIDEPIIAKQEADARPIMWIALYSDIYSTLKLTDIGDNILKDSLQTVKGVSSVILGGSKRYAIRIRLDSNRMAAHKVTVIDIERALLQQNVELPSGRLENQERELTIQTLGELKTPEEFNQLVIRHDGSSLVRLQDVGRAEAGVENERSVARYNSKPAMGLGIVKQSKANTIAVAKGIIKELERLKPSIPKGVKTFIAYDESTFVEQAIWEVWRTLGIAFILVVLTIYLFLNNLRSTFVPALTIPVSIITTFAIINAMGYSINILTMLALVLAIGLVVDDSIVVLENIYRHIEEGKKPLQAAFSAMKEISFAVIATTISLVAVFLPLTYQKSITGRLFTEFAITLCCAVIVSTFVALTLTPSVAARILKPISPESADKKSGGYFVNLTRRYKVLLERCLKHRGVVLGIVGVTLLLAGFFYSKLEGEFLPNEDKGRLFNLALSPEGSTSEYTDRMVKQMESIVADYPEIGGYFSAVALPRQGPGKGSEGLMFVRFRKNRDRSVSDVLDGPKGLRSRFFSEVKGALALAIPPKAIGGGFNQSFQLELQSNNLDKLDSYAQQIAAELRQTGMLQGVRSRFQFNKPELEISIKRNRAAALGVSIQDIARTLQILFGGRDLSTIKVDGEQYDVIIQLDRLMRLRPTDLEQVYIRNDADKLIQLNNLITYQQTAGPNAIFHYNRIRSATIEGTPLGQFALGSIMEKTEEILSKTLPAGFRYEWRGETSDLKESGKDTIFVILLALLTIYIVLAAQFESLLHPLTVMVALPLAAIGAFGSLWFLGLINSLGTSLYGWAHYSPSPPAIAGILSSLVPRIPSMTINIFSQIGMVLLLGLVTKNSILLVEFANQQMAKGKTATDAVLEAATIRFRPILMTALGTITGILPIAIGFGAGAESRRPMGIAIVGGMLSATLLTFFVIPVVYTLFDDLKNKLGHKKRLDNAAKLTLLILFLTAALPSTGQAQTTIPVEKDTYTSMQNKEVQASDKVAITLQKALDIALLHNADIKTAKEQIEKQRHVSIEIRSFVLPKLILDSKFEIIDRSLIQTFDNRSFGTNKNWDAKLEVRQPLYSGGKSFAAYDRQKLFEQAAILEFKEVIHSVVLEVKQRFFDILLARSQLSVRKQSVDLLQGEFRNEERRFKVGEVSQFNVLRAEVELANSRTPLIRAQNTLNLAYEELKRVTGFPLDSISNEKTAHSYSLDGKLGFKPYKITLDEALQKALTSRPTILRLKLLLDASNKGVDFELADYFPTISAIGSYGVEKSRFTDDLSDTFQGWRGSIEASWNVFDSLETKSRVAQARSEVSIAETALRQVRLDVEVEVRRAYSSLLEARALAKSSQKVVKRAEESLRLAKNRFHAGAGIQLDLLNSQVALTEARSNRAQALYDYNMSVARLKHAMGEGLPTDFTN